MKFYFSKTTFNAGETRSLPPCNVLRFKAVSGTVNVSFGDGDALAVATGDVFECPFFASLEKVTIAAESGASATVHFGRGSFGGGGGSGAMVQSTSGSPEGVLDASNGQLAYDSSAGAFYVNPNTSGTTGWVALIV